MYPFNKNYISTLCCKEKKEEKNWLRGYLTWSRTRDLPVTGSTPGQVPTKPYWHIQNQVSIDGHTPKTILECNHNYYTNCLHSCGSYTMGLVKTNILFCYANYCMNSHVVLNVLPYIIIIIHFVSFCMSVKLEKSFKIIICMQPLLYHDTCTQYIQNNSNNSTT